MSVQYRQGCCSPISLTYPSTHPSLHAIDSLMNTRGLVELIVLNLGLQAKILDVEIFTIVRDITCAHRRCAWGATSFFP